MSDAAETGTETATAKSPKRMLSALAVVVGIAAGVGAGLGVVAPRVAAGGAAEADGGRDAAGEHGGSAPALYTIDNLVLNPADTRGTRFLMLSIAAELDGPAAADALKGRDAAVRDTLIELLSSMGVEELTSVAHRDSIKAELRRAMQGQLRSGTVVEVFLPQFVVQ